MSRNSRSDLVKRALLCALLILAVCMSLAACTPEEPEDPPAIDPCDTCVDGDSDGVCDACGNEVKRENGEDDPEPDNPGTGDDPTTGTPGEDDNQNDSDGEGDITDNGDGSFDLPEDKFD